MKKIAVWAVLACLNLSMAAFFSGCAAQKQRLKLGETAEGEVVEAEGLAAVTPDLIAVKRAAQADAFKNAIEKVVGVFISARTMVDKAITIEQNILGKTDGYIKKHEVLKEGVEKDGLYHTWVRALVSYREIERDLKELDVMKMPALGNPRVAVLMDETIQGSEEQTTAASDALTQVLLEKGYKMVDRTELAAIRVAEATRELLSGDSQEALKPIVQKLNAEVVITGEAKSSLLTAQGLGGLVSYRGSMTGKALKAQTGEILATVNVQGSGLDATREAAALKAMAAIGAGAGKEFSEKIAKELARRSTVLVTVRGIPGIDRLGQIKDALARAPGIGEIYMRSFSGSSAEIEVKLNSATSASIAQAVAQDAVLKADVVSQTQDSLEIQVRP
ncbi:MAG: hypothetical protein A2902_01100 [Elusimicrobia bacterium RIFCSPLOWO2_01_FULL_64_13]|nr:MAG: hypothetical protein A2636_03690 [Elusimicrobia bacterium RIFCSPHIGHO2_01_FULL_64_10]OGR97892.1 MAG: hypothetical protein A2902_01100 [Elusimicrobia bacterium RIFCSPLOWO2_01_FULL_64_13]